jgi:hypothetical protein
MHYVVSSATQPSGIGPLVSLNSRLAGIYSWFGCCGKEESLCPSEESNPGNPACGLVVTLTFTKRVNEKIKMQPKSQECKLVSIWSV